MSLRKMNTSDIREDRKVLRRQFGLIRAGIYSIASVKQYFNFQEALMD